jgi:hypothetical protein
MAGSISQVIELGAVRPIDTIRSNLPSGSIKAPRRSSKSTPAPRCRTGEVIGQMMQTGIGSWLEVLGTSGMNVRARASAVPVRVPSGWVPITCTASQ